MDVWQAAAIICRRQSRYRKSSRSISELYNDGPVLENTLPVYHDLLARLQTELLLHDLATVISKQQMDMVRMRSHGYNIREIARRHNVPMQDVKMLLAGACAALKQLCYEY